MRKRLALAGLRFGRLTVIERVGDKGRESAWRCICDCGTESVVRASLLLQGRSTSCGCRKAEVGRKIMDAYRAENNAKNFLYGTSVRAISQGLLKNNTSGCAGVSWSAARQKWEVEIGFQKKRYRLGRYARKADAIAVRKAAESALHGEFLEWYDDFRTGKTTAPPPAPVDPRR